MTNDRIDRKQVLNVLIKHETLSVNDLATKEYLGMTPDVMHLSYLLEELTDGGFLQYLPGVTPRTYTITTKGIDEGLRLRNYDGKQRSL